MRAVINLFNAAYFLVFVGCASSESMRGSLGESFKPNILWIIAEDMSPDLGCYGNFVVTTPNIDQLAARGMKFNRVFTTAPACSPSRTSLATGVYQTTLGAYHMRYSDELMPELPSHVKVLPELMRENGYYTGNISDVCGTGSGKDDWLFKTSSKAWDTKSWDDLVRNEPFYGIINMQESHRAFARKARTKIEEAEIDIPPYYPDHPVSRNDWAGYLEDVNRADELVGAILSKLERDGKSENTIIIFLSDHGRPMIRGKNWLYDSGTHIPLVIYYPDGVERPEKFRAGGENSNLVSAVDLVAETLLAAGGAVPDWMQGRSFLQSDSVERDFVYTSVDRIGNINTRSRAVRNARFKYIRNFKRPGSVNECSTSYRRAMHPIYHLLNAMGERSLLTPAQEQLMQPIASEELYDLKNDPYETLNLIGNPVYASEHEVFKSKLSEWIEKSGDLGVGEEDPSIAEYFDNYGKITTRDLEKYGATTTDKLKREFERVRAYVESYFD